MTPSLPNFVRYGKKCPLNFLAVDFLVLFLIVLTLSRDASIPGFRSLWNLNDEKGKLEGIVIDKNLSEGTVICA
jgi:hypothetical protein